jgi:hypothetical protein
MLLRIRPTSNQTIMIMINLVQPIFIMQPESMAVEIT